MDKEGIDFIRYFGSTIRKHQFLEEKKKQMLKKNTAKFAREAESRRDAMAKAQSLFKSYLEKLLEKSEKGPLEDYVIHQDRYRQLWVIIKRLEELAMWELEYLMNFGISLDSEIALRRALKDISLTDDTNWF